MLNETMMLSGLHKRITLYTETISVFTSGFKGVLKSSILRLNHIIFV